MKERNIRLDFIRTVAIIFVICSHFLDFGGVYAKGNFSLVISALRMLFTSCVALFMMLTGYLQCEKKLSLNFYFKGILKIYGIYFLCSALTFFIKGLVLREELSLQYMVGSFFNFYSCTYAWYLMLYMGLLGLIPFLNIIFNNLNSKKQHLCLLAVFFYFTILPTLMNSCIQLQSVWWKNLFPVTYYFTGAYLKRYRLEMPPWKPGMLMLAMLLVFMPLNTLIYGSQGEWVSVVCYYDHYQMYFFSLCFFVLLLNVPAEKITGLARRFMVRVSELSLAMYLMSGLADEYVYSAFKSYVPEVERSLWYIFPAVLTVFTASLVMAQLIMWLHRPFDRALKITMYKIFPKLKD